MPARVRETTDPETVTLLGMISLVLIVRRFTRVVRSGWSDREFRGLFAILAAWIAMGTLIFSFNEGWSVVESFYFCVMTLTTIGYGDFSPTSSAMQLYTVLYAVMGLGLFVAFNARLVQVYFETRRHDDDAASASGPDEAATGSASG